MIKTILILIQVVLIARFHLEISRLNAHIEPISSLRKLTNPLVLPMKRLMPVPWAQKFAAIKVAYLLTLILLIASIGMYGGPIIVAFWLALVRLLLTWVAFLKYGMILFVIMSWVTVFAGGSSAHPLIARTTYVLNGLFQPLLQPIQRVLPGLGGLDLSPLVFFFALLFVEGIIYQLINATGGG